MKNRTDGELFYIIRNGKGEDMPPEGDRAKDDDIWNMVNYIRAYEVAHGVVKADAYTTTLHIMAGLLVVGFICNLAVKHVNEKHHMSASALAADRT